jgi:DNA-binding NtrC family response regulator
VLLVEDEDAIRFLLRRVLEMRGFLVLAAAAPEDALRAAAEYPGRVDVMVVDVSLPGMDGRELVAAVRVGRPDVKVVLMSGYPRDEVFGPELRDMRAEFLSKPFTPNRLADLLAQLLAPAPAAGRGTVAR